MDNTSRVGNVSSSTSIATMNSRDGGRSGTMDSYSVGKIGNTIANSMVDGGSISKEPSIAKMTTISISTIQSISFSLTLGDVDNTSRVGNVSSSTSITAMNSRDCSRSSTMDSYSVGNIGNTIPNSMVDGGSITKMSNTITNASIAKMATISKSTKLSISFSLTLGNTDNTSRVGKISSSASITTMNSRDGSRSSTMDSYRVGNIGNTITNSMVDGGSITNMSSPIAKTSIAKMTTISISTELSISFSLTLGNMDNTSRVGNVSSSTSITTMNSRDGGRSST